MDQQLPNSKLLTNQQKYKKEMKEMAILTWLSVPFLGIISLIWLYYGGKTGPWIILGFSVFQNIPMAVMYTIRYNRCKSFLEIHGKLTEELHLLKNQHLGRKI